MALDIIGGLGRLAGIAAKEIGKAAWGGTKTATKTAAKATLYGSEKLTKGMVKAAAATTTIAAKGGAAVAKDIWRARNKTGPTNVLGSAVHTVGAMGRGMGKWERAKDTFDPITGKVKHTDGKFNLGTFGKVAFFGPAAAAGALEASDAYMDNRVGTISSNVVTATPTPGQSTPSYANNGGATGDLVFAMHANRHG